MRHIQYAVHKEDGLVMSRVAGHVAWPVLQFDRIGMGGDGYEPGDFNGPTIWKLEASPVETIGKEWSLLKWTRKIPVRLKNRHRRFWGMPSLPVPMAEQTEQLRFW